MSLRKKYRKYVNKAKPFVSKATMGLYDGGSSSDEDGQRAEAAGRMVKKDTTKQAGGGQIKYTTEEWQD